jgi:pimeloyl-ACP methyl ester carboxylesterase
MMRVEIDAQVGSSFIFVDRRDGEDVEHSGEYLEIDGTRRLAFTFRVPKYSKESTRVLIDIVSREGGRDLPMTHETVPPDYLSRNGAGWTRILAVWRRRRVRALGSSLRPRGRPRSAWQNILILIIIHPFEKMANNLIVVRSGRKLEVQEYGDPSGHPVFFFHGLIGSHYQASYVAEQAERDALRIIAPNRPGVGRSEFVSRKSGLDAVDDVEDLAAALELDDLSVIGISGGTPYALAACCRLGRRVRTVTIISGMGPMRLPGALDGMERRRRFFLWAGSRYPRLARRVFNAAAHRFRADPERFLQRLITTWSIPDQHLFRRGAVFELFLKDLHQVFTEGNGAEGLAQELTIYRNYGFSLGALPPRQRVTLWHGLSDNIVPPAMAWKMVRALPNAEATFVPGGHFMAIDSASQIIARLKQLLVPSC